MITREDLNQAINECQAERDPDSRTCIKLAAFLTIRDYLYSDCEPHNANDTDVPGYSYAAPPDVSHETEPTTVYIDSASEFAEAINGMETDKAWALMDELMKTLKIINPRLYNAVMWRIKE